ncbi:MAG: DUF1801 domain-containing protein [Rhizomicrobium sp.]
MKMSTVKKKKKARTTGKSKPRLLSSGNPQIAKADGETPVGVYIAAMPGWKRAMGRRLDALITRAVPGVAKVVRWNSPIYGVPGQGAFLGFQCYTRYIKIAFFRGAALTPLPTGPSKVAGTRYLDIREDAPLDEAQFVRWVKQASSIPGWRWRKE